MNLTKALLECYGKEISMDMIGDAMVLGALTRGVLHVQWGIYWPHN